MRNKHLKYAISEGGILRQIQFPFIINLHYSFQTSSNLYLAIDYCQRGDLAKVILDKGWLDEDQATFVICQMVLAIEYLHSQNIVYRDMKPENILIDSDYNWKLGDFGLAKENVVARHKSSFWGSPAYVTPELLIHDQTGKESDCYQLGILLYEMLVGSPPFYSENIDLLYQQIEKGKYAFPEKISENAKDLIQRLLVHDPSSRLDISGIKSHKFLSSIDWEDVMLRKVTSPLISLFSESNSPKPSDFVPVMFSDQDYQDPSETFNRVKGFSFAK